MSLTEDETRALAEAFDEAERTRVRTRAASQVHRDITIDDAYAVQWAWREMRLARGEREIGRKIGLTSRAMQLAVGIDEPDYGFLTDAMVIDDGATIPADRFIEPRFEVELGFKLKETLAGPDVTVFDVLDATDWIAPAFEVIDNRAHFKDPETGEGRKVMDTIADNASNAGVIWGGLVVRPDEVDLRMIPGVLYVNGKIEETGVSAGVLGHPANGLVWLARRLATRGVAIEAGEFVLSGSFTRPVYGRPGDTLACDFGPLGTVTCSIAKETA